MVCHCRYDDRYRRRGTQNRHSPPTTVINFCSRPALSWQRSQIELEQRPASLYSCRLQFALWGGGGGGGVSVVMEETISTFAKGSTLSLTHKSIFESLIKIYFILDFCFIYLAEKRTDGGDESADNLEKLWEGYTDPNACCTEHCAV